MMTLPTWPSARPLAWRRRGLCWRCSSALVVRFNPREVAEWVEHVAKNALSFGDSVDDVAREYAQRIAPFTTLTDEELAALDAFPGDEADVARG